MSSINLLPDDYVQRGQRRRANILCGALFAVTMAAVMAAWWTSSQAVERTRSVRNEVDASYAYATTQLEQLKDLEVKKQQMLGKAQAIGALLERVPRSSLLGTIANALPETASLIRVDLDCKKVITNIPLKSDKTKFEKLSTETPQNAPPTVTMELIGLAGTDGEVAHFIASLARCNLIASVDLVYSQEKVIDKQSLREFQIHLELRRNADALGIASPPTVLAGKADPKALTGVTE